MGVEDGGGIQEKKVERGWANANANANANSTFSEEEGTGVVQRRLAPWRGRPTSLLSRGGDETNTWRVGRVGK